MKLNNEKVKQFLDAFEQVEVEAVMIITRSGFYFKSATAHRENNGVVKFDLRMLDETFHSWKEFVGKVDWTTPLQKLPENLSAKEQVEWIKSYQQAEESVEK